ncbi:dynactin [Cystoisospora suis]|uniref:Dynactin subunit 5 n=1 Tax=Cystoisospora suis TaxID=483139 RepID=A0A2C6LCT5_9APIC|nr:dynactin [Cystoisospora suis]
MDSSSSPPDETLSSKGSCKEETEDQDGVTKEQGEDESKEKDVGTTEKEEAKEKEGEEESKEKDVDTKVKENSTEKQGEEESKEKDVDTKEKEEAKEKQGGEETKEKHVDTKEKEEGKKKNDSEEHSSFEKPQEGLQKEASHDEPSEQSSSSSASSSSSLSRNPSGDFPPLGRSPTLGGSEEEHPDTRDVTYASHVPLRGYASTGGVLLESDQPDEDVRHPALSRFKTQAFGGGKVSSGLLTRPVSRLIPEDVPHDHPLVSPPRGSRMTEGQHSPSHTIGEDTSKTSTSYFATQKSSRYYEKDPRRFTHSSRDDDDSEAGGLLPTEAYVPFSRFIVPSLENPSCYPRSDYITTASGNRVGRGTLLFGSQNITLAGRCVVSQGVILRGDLISLRFGRYVYLDENVLVHPSSYRSKGQTLHVPLTVGDYVTIGSNTVIRAVAIGSCVTIGQDCVIGNRCILKDYCKLLPGTVLAPDTVVPSFTVFGGKPGRMIGEVPEGDMILLKLAAIRKYNLFLPDDYENDETLS